MATNSDRFVVVEDNTYNVDISGEKQAACDALDACDLKSARIRIGHPDDPESYASEYELDANGSIHMRTGR